MISRVGGVDQQSSRGEIARTALGAAGMDPSAVSILAGSSGLVDGRIAFDETQNAGSLRSDVLSLKQVVATE